MLNIAKTSHIEKFYCLDCESRFEEEIYDELRQDFFCLECHSLNILPFKKGEGCSSEGCGNRAEGEGRSCNNCENGCGKHL